MPLSLSSATRAPALFQASAGKGAAVAARDRGDNVPPISAQSRLPDYATGGNIAGFLHGKEYSMQIDQKFIAEFVHLGGQYFLPVAALLRALYSGIRGRFPEGVMQIIVASVFAGLTALVGNQQPNWRSVILTVLGNTVFMAGLLAFIMAYLLRMQNRGFTVDAIVGGVIGLIVFIVWTVVLQYDWPWWSFPAAIAVGAAGFVGLRILLRQIARLVRLATYLIILGVILVIGAGGILFGQTVLHTITTLQAGH